MNKQEMKTLKNQLKFAENPKKYKALSFNILGFGWLGYLVVLIFLVELLNNGSIKATWAFTICTLLGLVLGYVGAYYSAARQWEFIEKYVDINSIRKRIEELER